MAVAVVVTEAGDKDEEGEGVRLGLMVGVPEEERLGCVVNVAVAGPGPETERVGEQVRDALPQKLAVSVNEVVRLPLPVHVAVGGRVADWVSVTEREEAAV